MEVPIRNLITLIAVAVVSVSAMASPALALAGHNTETQNGFYVNGLHPNGRSLNGLAINTPTQNKLATNTVQDSYGAFQIQSIVMPDGKILTIK
jgi:hypothetical protein